MLWSEFHLLQLVSLLQLMVGMFIIAPCLRAHFQLISKAASEGNFRLKVMFPANQCQNTHYLMICQMPFEINRVFVTHSAMPANLHLHCMLCSSNVSGLVVWADACSNL